MCARFISHMLRNRIIYTSTHNLSRKAERGCPQGGVLSPLLWNLVVDELLSRLRSALPQVYSCGFADDLGAISRGPDLGIVTGLAQRSLDIMQRWSREVDLGIEGDKVAVLHFTRRRVGNKKKLVLNGKQIPFSKPQNTLACFWTTSCRDLIAWTGLTKQCYTWQCVKERLDQLGDLNLRWSSGFTRQLLDPLSNTPR